MDFLKILKSLEEFVYEALTWLILLPRTLLRIIVRPLRMTHYADSQMSSVDTTRFDDALSPPLLLILCILIAHFADVGLRTPTTDATGSLASVILASDQNLLLYRTVAFGVWALAGAVFLLLRRGVSVNRETLRAPVYEQCYLVSPFALFVSLGTTLDAIDPSNVSRATALLLVMAIIWFWWVQVAWIRHKTALAWWTSAIAATAVLAIGSVVNAGVGYVLTHPAWSN